MDGAAAAEVMLVVVTSDVIRWRSLRLSRPPSLPNRRGSPLDSNFLSLVQPERHRPAKFVRQVLWEPMVAQRMLIHPVGSPLTAVTELDFMEGVRVWQWAPLEAV